MTRAEQVAALSDEMVRFMLERIASETDQRCEAAAKDYKAGDMWGAGLSFGLGSIKGSLDTWFDLLVKEQAEVEAHDAAVVDEVIGAVIGGGR